MNPNAYTVIQGAHQDARALVLVWCDCPPPTTIRALARARVTTDSPDILIDIYGQAFLSKWLELKGPSSEED